jgi:pSer/pThr/pTyr-binding forkhead associated (FHA) protein
MISVMITFEAGPQRGESRAVDLGNLLIGREPAAESHQQALILVGAGQSISRTHCEIAYHLGEVRLRSISANGTKVNGKAVPGEIVLSPGDTVSPSDDIQFKISWRAPEKVQPSAVKTAEAAASPGVLSSGPLASPLIRAVLAVYLLGIVAVAVWINVSNSGPSFDDSASADLKSSYTKWGEERFSADELESRLSQIDADLETLRVAIAREQKQTARIICRRLRAMDATEESPVYRYAATCLAQL